MMAFAYKRTITIDHTKIDSDLTNYPVMVKLNSANFDYDSLRDDYNDLAFYNGSTLLPFERENADQYGVYLNATSKLSLVDSDDFDFINGDYTLEAKMRVIGLADNVLLSQWMGTSSAFQILVNANGHVITIAFFASQAYYFVSDSLPDIIYEGALLDIAIVRSGTTGYMFINGSLIKTFTHSATYKNSPYAPTIGGYYDRVGYLSHIGGIRLTKGVARYTASYTVPSAFTFDQTAVKLCINFNTLGATTFTDLTGKTITSVGSPIITKINANLICYVKIPSVSSEVDTTFTMKYGDSTQSTDLSNTNDVWDSNYVMVQHMGTSLIDSTGNGLDGTAPNGRTIINSNSIFDGISEHVEIADNNLLDFGVGTFMLQSIFNVDAFPLETTNCILSKRQADEVGSPQFSFYISSDTNMLTLSSYYNGFTIVSATTPVVINTLTYATAIRNSNGLHSIYQNGVLSDSLTGTVRNVTNNQPFWIGEDNRNNYNSFNGMIGEVRISNIARNDAWIRADDYNLRLNTLISIGYQSGTGFNAVNIGGVWKSTVETKVNIGGVWKTATTVFTNINGVWKEGI